MFDRLRLWFGLLVRLFRSRESLLVENLALRQQLAVFKRDTQAPQIGSPGKVVVGCAPALLIFVEKRPDCGHARYCDPVAPCWFSALLAASFQSAKAAGPETHQQGDPRIDLPNGCGESDLAGASHSRQTRHARIRAFGAKHRTMDAGLNFFKAKSADNSGP